MEADQPPAAASEADPAISSSSQEQGSSTVSPSSTIVTRSYECTFCKRGFSNAQALGGHMNIHRKKDIHRHDNTKQPSHFPFDITPAPRFPTSYMPAAPTVNLLFDQQSCPASTSRDREGGRPPTGPDCDRAHRGVSFRQDDETEKKIEQTEIDLELRLGP